ncbi:HdeD family acid-resistance protein [Rhodocaloribacter sp.]
MFILLFRSWRSLLLRGLAAVLFGVLSLMWPQLSLAVLVLLVGAFLFVDGVLSIWAALRGRREESRWWLLLADGLLGVGIGVVTFLWPGITALALLYLIAAWAVLTGILEIAAAAYLRKVIEGEWLLGLSGVLSVLFGLGIALFPGAGAVALVAVIATFAILYGAILIALAFKVKKLQHLVEEESLLHP